MSKLQDIRALSEFIGMPEKQQMDLYCYALLTMADIKESEKSESASSNWIRIHDIINP